MAIFGWIEKIYGTVARKKKIRKLQLEIEDLERNRSQIKQLSEEDIREYDHKRENLESKIETVREKSIEKWFLWVAIATLGVTTIGVILGGGGEKEKPEPPIHSIEPAISITEPTDRAAVGEVVEEVEQPVDRHHLKITSPSDGDSVSMNEPIQGKTPFSGMHHYVIVTPVEARRDFVEGEAKVTRGGSWSGQAVFGGATAGVDQKFVVRALATESTLTRGPLIESPKDARFSEPITVIRKK